LKEQLNGVFERTVDWILFERTIKNWLRKRYRTFKN
jgi:hypothetical protein